MTKREFLKTLDSLLSHVPMRERQKAHDFYEELIDDHIESGLTEEDAVATLEDVNAIAHKIINESQNADIPAKRKKTWLAVTLAATCIIWGPIAISLAVTLLCLYISIWAVAISLFAAAIGCIISLPFCILTAFFLLTHNVPSAVFQLGAGLGLCGIGLFILLGCIKLSRGLIFLTKYSTAMISKLFRKVADTI